MQKGNFAPLIGRLEKRGLVVREACSADGRKQRMRLTASGNALVARGIELNNAFEAHVIAHMGLPQHQELIRLLNVLRRVPPYTKAAAKAAIPRRAPLKKKSIPQG
jgi:DNA-binding MarR family transcriptional regulator